MNYTFIYEILFFAVTALSIAYVQTTSFIEKKVSKIKCFLLLAVPKFVQLLAQYYIADPEKTIAASILFGVTTLFFDFALFFLVFDGLFQQIIILMFLCEVAFIPMLLFENFVQAKFPSPDGSGIFIPGIKELLFAVAGYIVAVSVAVLITKLADRLLKKINYNTKIFNIIGIAGVVCYFVMEFVVLTLDVSKILKQETIFRYLLMLVVWSGFCVLMYLVNDYFTKKKLKREIAVLSGEAERQFEYYSLMKNRNEEIQKIRHDMKNHLMTISSLIASKEYDRVKTYLTSLDEQFSRIKRLDFTGNITVDTVISDIKEKCTKENIDFTINGCLAQKTGVDDISMTCVMTNILNNAYEACLRADENSEKFIKLDIVPSGGCIVIKCQNSKSVSEKPGLHNYKSSKSGYGHGYGMRIIKDIVGNYDGVTEINDNGNVFEMKVLLTEKEEI
ncbi:MAG: GHKL domain-containing protein [Clostridia bacterium]|nr:GHKL domain-containing protein [Clostridia bacterium]